MTKSPGSENSMITAEIIAEWLTYNPETGEIRWLEIPQFRMSGQKAGCVTQGGYSRITVLKETHFAHRLAWLMHYGEWPKGQVDHINGNGLDNRALNLRVASVVQNQANAKTRIDSATGFKGVSAKGKRYEARIKIAGRQVSLGRFETAEAAHRAYVDAARKLHGEFAHDGVEPLKSEVAL